MTPEEIIKSIEMLPPFPATAAKAVAELEQPEPDFKKVVELISLDPNIVANILRLCNSPYYGLVRQISSVSEAVVILGIDELREIIFASGLNRVYPKKKGGYSAKPGELWQHSSACAIMSRIIMRKVNIQNSPAVFTAALMHDIGKIVLGWYIDKEAPNIKDAALSEEKDFCELEQEFFGIDHAELGAKIAEAWNFPESLSIPIKHHHHPESSNGGFEDVTRVVHLSDVLSLYMGLGTSLDGLAYRPVKEALEYFDFSQEDLEDIMASFMAEYERASVLMSI